MRTNLAAKVALAAGGLAFGLVLGELGLRILWHNPYAAEAPDHLLKLFIQHPGTDHWVDRVPIDAADPRVRFRSDSRSYILPSFQYPDPDVTIAFLGGSTTANTAVREDLRFHGLVSKLLAEKGIRANTLNAARSGGTLHDSLNVLLNHVVQDRPEIAVVMHAANDVGVLSSRGSYDARMGHPVKPLELAKWATQMLSSRLSLVGLARRSLIGGKPSRGSFARIEERNAPDEPPVPLEPFRARLRAFVHLCRDFGIEPVLMTQPLSSSRNALTPEWADLGSQDQFNAVIREVGREQGALVIDLVRYLQEEVPGWDEPDRIFYDGMHVNDAGSRAYATHIAERLAPLARSLAERKLR